MGERKCEQWQVGLQHCVQHCSQCWPWSHILIQCKMALQLHWMQLHFVGVFPFFFDFFQKDLFLFPFVELLACAAEFWSHCGLVLLLQEAVFAPFLCFFEVVHLVFCCCVFCHCCCCHCRCFHKQLEVSLTSWSVHIFIAFLCFLCYFRAQSGSTLFFPMFCASICIPQEFSCKLTPWWKTHHGRDLCCYPTTKHPDHNTCSHMDTCVSNSTKMTAMERERTAVVSKADIRSCQLSPSSLNQIIPRTEEHWVHTKKIIEDDEIHRCIDSTDFICKEPDHFQIMPPIPQLASLDTAYKCSPQWPPCRSAKWICHCFFLCYFRMDTLLKGLAFIHDLGEMFVSVLGFVFKDMFIDENIEESFAFKVVAFFDVGIPTSDKDGCKWIFCGFFEGLCFVDFFCFQGQGFMWQCSHWLVLSQCESPRWCWNEHIWKVNSSECWSCSWKEQIHCCQHFKLDVNLLMMVQGWCDLLWKWHHSILSFFCDFQIVSSHDLLVFHMLPWQWLRWWSQASTKVSNLFVSLTSVDPPSSNLKQMEEGRQLSLVNLIFEVQGWAVDILFEWIVRGCLLPEIEWCQGATQGMFWHQIRHRKREFLSWCHCHHHFLCLKIWHISGRWFRLRNPLQLWQSLAFGVGVGGGYS